MSYISSVSVDDTFPRSAVEASEARTAFVYASAPHDVPNPVPPDKPDDPAEPDAGVDPDAPAPDDLPKDDGVKKA